VLTGGTGARLGGVDKAGLKVGGTTLLERALAAVRSARRVVVVGDPVATSREVTWTRETPAGGGPAAGLLAGLAVLSPAPELVVALACDMPWVSSATLDRLLAAAQQAQHGAVLVDRDGRRQTLAAAYRYEALSRGRPADPADARGMALRRLVGELRLVDVPAVGDEARDVDTWEDL